MSLRLLITSEVNMCLESINTMCSSYHLEHLHFLYLKFIKANRHALHEEKLYELASLNWCQRLQPYGFTSQKHHQDKRAQMEDYLPVST
jgi:hypothetical protein